MWNHICIYKPTSLWCFFVSVLLLSLLWLWDSWLLLLVFCFLALCCNHCADKEYSITWKNRRPRCESMLVKRCLGMFWDLHPHCLSESVTQPKHAKATKKNILLRVIPTVTFMQFTQHFKCEMCEYTSQQGFFNFFLSVHVFNETATSMVHLISAWQRIDTLVKHAKSCQHSPW